MKLNIAQEIIFQTARSGGKGGQNVNKVETMVEGRWPIKNSQLISKAQKEILFAKLHNKINADGFLLVKSQTARTQLGNKENVIEKINKLVNTALSPKKLRIATKPSKASKEKRIENKKRKADIKTNRRKLRHNNF